MECRKNITVEDSKKRMNIAILNEYIYNYIYIYIYIYIEREREGEREIDR